MESIPEDPNMDFALHDSLKNWKYIGVPISIIVFQEAGKNET